MPRPPTEQPATQHPTAARIDLLESTQFAFSQSALGQLSIIDLVNAAQNLIDSKHPDIAVQLYRLWLAQTQSPLAYAAQFNLGVLLEISSDDIGAEAIYREVIEQKQDFIDAYLSLANLLERTERPDEALSMWRSVLEIANPTAASDKAFHVLALTRLGRLLEVRDELPEAEIMLARSLKEDPSQVDAMMRWIHLRQKGCQWPVYSANHGFKIADMIVGTSVLAMFGVFDDPALQLATARCYVYEHVLREERSLSSKHPYGHARLHVGYLSWNFCSSPTSALCGLHDRAKFEVFAFDSSPEDSSPSCAGFLPGVAQHIRIGHLTDTEAAHLIRSHEIDILIDLDGLAREARPNILSYRPAPVQIVWSGFPGSTALPEIDYVIADSFVLPPELEPFFTEKPLRLPHTFQVFDHSQSIRSRRSRKSFGLPTKMFVFCCFNSNDKFTPDVFGTWMRILKRVPDSLLWLAVDHAWARDNLRRQAHALGVDPARLYFANCDSQIDDLACFQIADLFLDTFPFNGGQTIGNALWAGLPVLTCVGRSFASRMTGSMLGSVNLPELIAYNMEEYENKAVNLALNPSGIAALRQQLEDHTLSYPLFDVLQFVHDIETQFSRLIDALPSRPPRPSLGVNLDYLKPPNTARNFSQAPKNIKDRRYVIVAPPFEHNSAGIRVLYELQKWLVIAGLDAMVCTLFSGYPVEQFADDVVIYPEVAPGNPLKAKRVIRYILNVPGKLGYGEKQYDRNEVLVAYNKELAHYSNGIILQVPAIEPFFRPDDTPKIKNAVYVGKGSDLKLHPTDCVYITKTFPPTRREVALFLRGVKTLYMYDDFSMLGEEARLCGCDVKLIGKDGMIVEYPFTLFPSIDEFKAQLHDFIEISKNL